jgi:hypothetical protein
MASTTFTDGVTLIVSAWLNDVDTVTYDRFGDGSSYTGNLTVPGTSVMTGKITATAAGIDVPTTELGTAFGSSYTPVLSAGSNVAASTMFTTGYMRVGNQVEVSGACEIDPTATGSVSFELSLPVASNLGAISDLGGVCLGSAGRDPGRVWGVVANDTALFEFNATNAGNQTVPFKFGYRII